MIGIHVTNGARVGLFDGIDRSMNWTGAACVGHDPELWYPQVNLGQRADWTVPRAICDTCPIRERCLNYAMQQEAGYSLDQRAGMWGGKTPEERADMDPERRSRGPADFLHGTRSGARRHRALHEKPCNACRIAEYDAQAERRARRKG